MPKGGSPRKPRTVLLELAESSNYAIRYEALRLLALDVPAWPPCDRRKHPRNHALRALALDRKAPLKMRIASCKCLLWGLELDVQERQEAELRAMKTEAAEAGKNRAYTKTAKWYAKRGLPNPASGQPGTAAPA